MGYIAFMGRRTASPNSANKRMIRFVVTVLILLVIGAVLYPFISIALAKELRGFMAITARLCGSVLTILVGEVEIADRVVTLPRFSIEIVEECTGVFEMLIFLAALLAYPASWRSKLIGFLTGLPALYLLNIIRIIFLAIIGGNWPILFDFMHLYFWQATLILMITTIWVLWIVIVVNREKKTAHLLA